MDMSSLERDTNESPFDVSTNHTENNDRLLNVYEYYLSNECPSGSDSDTEISFGDDLTKAIETRLLGGCRRPTRRSSARFSSLTQIRDVSAHSSTHHSINHFYDNSGIESDAKLPFDLNAMTETEIIELTNKLSADIEMKMNCYPEMVANNIETVFEKNIQHIKSASNTDSNDEKTDSIAVTNQRKIDYHQLIAKEMNDIQRKSEKFKKLIENLKVCRDICQNSNPK